MLELPGRPGRQQLDLKYQDGHGKSLDMLASVGSKGDCYALRRRLVTSLAVNMYDFDARNLSLTRLRQVQASYGAVHNKLSA